MLELHNAVPARGAVLVSINIRLSLDEMCYIVDHSGSSVLIATAEFAQAAASIRDRTGVRTIVEHSDIFGQKIRELGARMDDFTMEILNFIERTTGVTTGVR